MSGWQKSGCTLQCAKLLDFTKVPAVIYVEQVGNYTNSEYDVYFWAIITKRRVFI